MSMTEIKPACLGTSSKVLQVKTPIECQICEMFNECYEEVALSRLELLKAQPIQSK